MFKTIILDHSLFKSMYIVFLNQLVIVLTTKFNSRQLFKGAQVSAVHFPFVIKFATFEIHIFFTSLDKLKCHIT